jgi:type II secretory pathway pseudopilin PulG
MKKYMKKSFGFSLIEVMLAVFVLSIGILAVAKFQGSLLQSGSNTKAKTAALTLAQQKIDDLRGFGQIEVGSDCGGGTDPCTWSDFTPAELATKQMAYVYIDDNKGGRFAPNTTFNLAFNNENYQRIWEVKDNIDEPEKLDSMKWVKVSVAWQDQNGDTQTVSLESLIPAISPALTNIAIPGAGASPTPPNFTYTPGAAPDVIKVEIDAGDGQYKETSKVLPDVSQDGDNNLVTFSAVTFTTSLGVSTIDNIDEYSTVNCNCTFNGTGSGFTPSRFVWNDATKEVFDKRGEVVTKITATEDNNGSGSETVLANVCTQCCRDHHDSNDSTAKYVPGTASSGNHTHYNSSGTAVTTGDYVEACRLKSIDGILSTFQDWQLKTTTTIPSSYLADDTATQTAYKDYVADYISNYTEGGALPTAPTSRDITSLPQGATQQLLVRAIYIDEVEQESSEYTTCVNGIGVADDACENVNPIRITPFAEINLTKLANWKIANNTTVASGTDTQANDLANESPCPPSDTSAMTTCVTDEDIVDEGLDENNYSRGLVVAGDVAGTERIIAYLNPDNTGITGTAAIQPESGSVDGSSQDDKNTTTTDARIEENPHSDYVEVTVAAGLTTYGISGDILFCTGTKNNEKSGLVAALTLTISGTSGSCSTNKQGNSYDYTCTGMVAGSNTTLSATGSNAFPSSFNFNPLSAGQTGQTITLCAS